jgi:hypothetical protein
MKSCLLQRSVPPEMVPDVTEVNNPAMSSGLSVPFEVGGPIAARWAEWNGAVGPFGFPVGPEVAVSSPQGRRQTFARGEIGVADEAGMTVSVFRLWTDALFEWSMPAENPDRFRWDVQFRAANSTQWVPQGHQDAEIHVEGQQQLWVRMQGYGDYAFVIRATDSAHFTVPVTIHLGGYVETVDPGNHPDVLVPIAERWHELGAWDGPFGLPLEPAQATVGGAVRQRFKHGSVTTAPAFGPDMTASACQRHNSVEVTWGGADRPFNAFRVDAYERTRFAGSEFSFQSQFASEWARPDIGSGTVMFHNLGDGLGAGAHRFSFHVFSTFTDDPFASPASPGLFPDVSGPPVGDELTGATPAATVDFEFVQGDVVVPFPPLDGGAAQAFATHKARADAIARHYASRRPLGLRLPQPDNDNPEMTEGASMQLVAHLHAMSADPEFCVPGELPSRFLVPIRLRLRRLGEVGTKHDYDMALKGLVALLYRYRRQLADSDVEYILQNLVPEDLVGPHDTGIDVAYTIPPIPPFEPNGIRVPETENHLLMIESTRYLVNQLHHDRTGEARFDNTANGMAAYLCDFMQPVCRFDFMEFNARPYQRLALHAIMNLYEFARDEEVRTAAQIVLDYVAMKFAVSSNRGRRVSPFRRLQERTFHPATEFNDIMAPRGDQVAGFFSMYLGLINERGDPMPFHFDGWTDTAIIAGVSSYRPPTSAYIVAREDHPPVQHIFCHGTRPRWPNSEDNADGGVEVYHQSPSFLLNAGGAFLNSGYGHDAVDVVVDAWAQTARAQAIVLLPTHFTPSFNDTIRFEPYPDPWDPPDPDEPVRGEAVNMGVCNGFACGANLRVPQLYLDRAGALWDGNWLFLDLDRDQPPFGPFGFYVAIYATPMTPDADVDPPPENLAVLHAMEADLSRFGGAHMSFEEFEHRTRARNADLPQQFGYGAIHTFNTADDRTYRFWLQQTLEKYRARAIDVTANASPIFEYTGRPLADGPYLRAPNGHDGLIEIRHPGCESIPLTLDYRNARKPSRVDNSTSCPRPHIDRAQAIIAYSHDLITKARAAPDPEHPVDPIVAMRYAVDAFRDYVPVAPARAEFGVAYAEALRIWVQFLQPIGAHDHVVELLREAVSALISASGGDGGDPVLAQVNFTAVAGELESLGLHDEAVNAQQALLDALTHYTPPANEVDAHMLDVAEANHNLIVRLLNAQMTDRLHELSVAAVTAYQQYAAADGQQLATTVRDLRDLAKTLDGGHLVADAVLANQAAVDILAGHQTVELAPGDHVLDLAEARHNLLVRLIEDQRIPEGIALVDAILDDYRTAASTPNGNAGRIITDLDQLINALAVAHLDDQAQRAAAVRESLATS